MDNNRIARLLEDGSDSSDWEPVRNATLTACDDEEISEGERISETKIARKQKSRLVLKQTNW